MMFSPVAVAVDSVAANVGSPPVGSPHPPKRCPSMSLSSSVPMPLSRTKTPPSLLVVDPVTAQRGVATRPDRHTVEAVAGDVVVLQRAHAAAMDEDAASLAVVDLVAAQRGSAPVLISTPAKALPVMSLSSSVPNRCHGPRRRKPCCRGSGCGAGAGRRRCGWLRTRGPGCDVAAFQVQAPLGDVYAVPFTAPVWRKVRFATRPMLPVAAHAGGWGEFGTAAAPRVHGRHLRRQHNRASIRRGPRPTGMTAAGPPPLPGSW